MITVTNIEDWMNDDADRKIRDEQICRKRSVHEESIKHMIRFNLFSNNS